MGQVAFDTLQASEEVQTAGLTSQQAKAISLVVRKSHEVADVATKRDLEDVRKEMQARFEKIDAQIADVRKDLSAEIADVRKDMTAGFDKAGAKTEAQIALLRKDMEFFYQQFIDKYNKFDYRLRWACISYSDPGC